MDGNGDLYNIKNLVTLLKQYYLIRSTNVIKIHNHDADILYKNNKMEKSELFNFDTVYNEPPEHGTTQSYVSLNICYFCIDDEIFSYFNTKKFNINLRNCSPPDYTDNIIPIDFVVTEHGFNGSIPQCISQKKK